MLNQPTATEPECGRAALRESQPLRGAEHDRMGVFAGRWHAEGVSFDRNTGEETPMVTDERWKWLPGGFFLVCRFDSSAGETRHCGFGYLGHDARAGHVLSLADNLGFERRYRLSSNGRVWTIRGERERATYEFSEDGRSIDIRWEQSDDGRDWVPLCRLRAVRTQGLGPTRH